MGSRDSPVYVHEISSGSDNELDIENIPMQPCMFPTSSRFSFDLDLSTDGTDEVTYIKTEPAHQGESSSDPILLSDSSSDNEADSAEVTTPAAATTTTTTSPRPGSSRRDPHQTIWLNPDILGYVVSYNNMRFNVSSRGYNNDNNNNSNNNSSNSGRGGGINSSGTRSHHHHNHHHHHSADRSHVPWHLQHSPYFPNLELDFPNLEYHYIPARLAIPSLLPQSQPPVSHLHSWPAGDTSTDTATQKLIEECTTKTRFIKRMPSKVKGASSKREAPKCAICLDEFVDRVRIRRLRCIHNFHVKCIDAWLKKNMICPICRKPIFSSTQQSDQYSSSSTSAS